MIVLLLSLILSMVCGWATWRWTRPLPVWQQRLVRSFLIALLCPPLIAFQESAPFAPTLVLVLMDAGRLKGVGTVDLVAEGFIIWITIFSLWMIIAGICSPHSDDILWLSRMKLAGTICSLPSWIFIVGMIFYRLWIDTESWPPFELIGIPAGICAAGSLIAMTLFLISMDDCIVAGKELFLVAWSAFPICLGMVWGCALWLFN